MYHVRSPSELLHGLKYTACEEDRSLAVVLEEVSVIVAIDAFSVEIILIINKIHLHPGCRDRCNLDYERSVHVVDDDVHSGKADNLMKLVLSFVYAAIARHERTDLLLSFLNALRQVSSNF